MSFRTILFIAIGFGLASVSHSVGLRGDAAPFVENGVSAERAQYHIAALVMLLGSMGCFIYAGVSAFRRGLG